MASAVTIGNFDGVHLGHQEILRRLKQTAKRLNVAPAVITFDPHPARIVAPERAPKLLSTVPQRLQWIREAGIENVLVIPFNREFMMLSPDQFIDQVLIHSLGAKAVLIGENFRFGHRHAGDTAMLQKRGFEVEIISGVRYRNVLVSSTEIRNRVLAGNVAGAMRMLGRPYGLEGTHVAGHGIGAKQTVPTLNLKTEAEAIPANGVYVTKIGKWKAVTNVGVRPTFNGEGLSIESFILEGYQEPAPENFRVDFYHRLREERKFESPEALKKQIMRDVAKAHAYWRRCPC
jgi:riboflavin kinase/FMN adenylyltransferase